MECDPNPDYDPAQDPDSDWRPYSDKSRGRRLPNPGDDPGIFCRDVIDDTQPLEALQGLGFDLALWAYFPHRNIEGVDGSRPAVEHQLAELQGIDEWVQEHTALPCFVEELGARSSRDLPDGGRGELRAAYAEALDLDNTVGAAIWTWRDDDHHSSSLNGNPTFRRLGADGAPIDYEIVGRPALMPIMSANAKGQPMPTQLALVDFSNHYIAYANAVPGKPLAIDVYTYGTDASGVTVLAELTWLDAQGEILGTFRHEWPGVDTSLNGLLTVTDPAPDGTSLALLSVRPEPGAAPLGLVMVSIKFSYADWGLRDLDSVPKPVLHDSQDEIDIRRINNLVK